MGKSSLQPIILVLLLTLAAASQPATAQSQNGIVQLQPNETIIIEGPLLGGQSKRLAEILAYLQREKKQHITIKLNSKGGSINEANFIVSAMQAFQRKGGTIRTEVPENGECWSVCPLIFAFGDRRMADDESSWLIHRVTPDVATIATHSSITTQMVTEKINAFWMRRFSQIDPKFAKRMQDEQWLIDGEDHAFSGEELRKISMGLFSSPKNGVLERKGPH